MAIAPQIAGMVLGATAGNVAAGLVGAAQGPVAYGIDRLAWFDVPHMLPPPDALLSARMRGFGSTSLLDTAMRRLGFIFAGQTDDASEALAQSAWRAVGTGMLIRPDPSLIVQAKTMGRINNDAYVRLMKQAGAAPDAWDSVQYMFRNLPSAETAFGALIRGLITEQQANWSMGLQGASVCDWLPMARAFETFPSQMQLNEARNRGFISEQGWLDGLRRLGLVGHETTSVLDRLRQQIPPISDVIRFAVREAFSPSVVARLGYDREFPETVQRIADQLGYFGTIRVKDPDTGVEQDVPQSLLYWRAHWQPISPSQGYTLLHRLRPGRNNYYQEQLRQLGAANPNVQPFGIDDLRAWLRVNDYPEPVRDMLAAVAFRPLRLVDIRSAYTGGLRGRQWFIDQQLDRGVAPDDAETLADIEDSRPAIRSRQAFERVGERAPVQALAAAISAHETGILSGDQVRQIGVPLGIRPFWMDVILQTGDLKRRVKLAREAINAIRRQYVTGELSLVEANAALAQLGISNAAAADYLAVWNLQRTVERKLLTLAKVQKYVAEGIMDVAEGIRRLANLGYPDPDRLLLISEAQATGARNRQREMAAEERTRRGAAKELERAVDETESEVRRLRTELNRVEPAAKLQGWLKKGLVSEDSFRRKFRLRGYPEEAIDKWVQEALLNGAK